MSNSTQATQSGTETQTCCEDHAGAHQLEVRNLKGEYGPKLALEGCSFETVCGRRLALLGPNGAGKSTLIRILAGLMKASEGEVFWKGKALNQATREIAYLPQVDQHQRHFPLSVREVVEMGRFPYVGHFGKWSTADSEAVEKAIETMQLENIANRQIDELSGGQQQRSFIARALAQHAHVILLDEPFNGLDVESRCHLAETLEDLAKGGHLIIASHHNLENVTEIFDEALVLSRRQVAFGEVNQVMASEEVKHLMHSCHPHQEGEVCASEQEGGNS